MLITASGYQGYPLPVFDIIGATVQNINYNAAGGASTPSSAFANSNTGITEAILVSIPTNATSGNVRIQIAAAPIASSSTTLLVAPGEYVFRVPKGGKIAVLSNDAGTGSICVTELNSILPHTNDGTQ